MHIFNRDYAVLTESGSVIMESHSKERCEHYAAELLAVDGLTGLRVVKSDCPRSRASYVEPYRKTNT